MRRNSSVYDCRDLELSVTDAHGPRSNWLPSTVFTDDNETYAQCRVRRSKDPFDLYTHDGAIASYSYNSAEPKRAGVTVNVVNIDPLFLGHHKDVTTEFVLKSSVAQLGIACDDVTVRLSKETRSATVEATFVAIDALGEEALRLLEVGCYVGKLMALDPRRLVRSVDYLTRLAQTSSILGQPLLAMSESIAEAGITTHRGNLVVLVPLLGGACVYDKGILNVLPTLIRALKEDRSNFKSLLRLHQHFDSQKGRTTAEGHLLLVRSTAFYAATVVGRVVTELLPTGVRVASSVIEPGMSAAADGSRSFVLYGQSSTEITHIPIELYTVESYHEGMPYRARRTLPTLALDASVIAAAFETIPHTSYAAATFVSKGGMLREMHAGDWVLANPEKKPYDPNHNEEQKKLVEEYIVQQAEYGILSAIAAGDITSEGILMTRYFPSPVMKPLLLARSAVQHLHAVYFTTPSRSHGLFFSQEDGAMLADLATFGIDVYYVDMAAKRMYKFIVRHTDAGLFVPLDRINDFHNAAFFGVYGSNLVSGNFEAELRKLLEGILELRKHCDHPYLNPQRPLALMTGGGPGAMEVGNRVAASLNILSCGMFVDFGSLSKKPGATINEQKKNPYVEAFMTYRPDKLVERQSNFHLDFPIFLTGGVGTDFEYALEEVRRKVGTMPAHPLILFGSVDHWGNKIRYRYQVNLESGTIRGSEWLSNVPWIVRNGAEALWTLTQYFEGKLPVGPAYPANDVGYMVAPSMDS